MAYDLHVLPDTSELVELFKPQSLFLKPISRLNVTVSLPQLKDAGQSISNWDLMERIKKLVHPINFHSIKVVKSSMEFVRFEADAENREHMAKAILKLDGNNLKVIGFFETFKVRACEAKSDFPARHDWDTFFRDSSTMNEMRPGERPDTIYLAQLPSKWFGDKRQRRQAVDADAADKPSELVLRRVFEMFGDLRCVDVPVCDAWRVHMSKTGMRTTGFSFGQHSTFEAYVQFVEYISFVRCMDALRGMKLVHIDADGKAVASCVKVDFDKTKHLSDKSIRRRRLERERLMELERMRRAEDEAKRMAEEEARKALDNEKTDRLRAREERRRVKHLERKRVVEAKEMEKRIRLEERKLLVAQRKLESIRLLTELLQRAQIVRAREEVLAVEADLERAVLQERLEKEASAQQEASHRDRLLQKHEHALRHKVAASMKHSKKHKQDIRKQEIRDRIKHEKMDSPGLEIISDDEDSDKPPDKRPRPPRERITFGRADSSYSGSANRKNMPGRMRAGPAPPVVVSRLHPSPQSRPHVNPHFTAHRQRASRALTRDRDRDLDPGHGHADTVPHRYVQSTGQRITVEAQPNNNGNTQVQIIIQADTPQFEPERDYYVQYEDEQEIDYEQELRQYNVRV